MLWRFVKWLLQNKQLLLVCSRSVLMRFAFNYSILMMNKLMQRWKGNFSGVLGFILTPSINFSWASKLTRVWAIWWLGNFFQTYPSTFASCCLTAYLASDIFSSASPEQAAQANLLCSVKQIQMVRQSLPAVIEMVTLQRYHFAHYKRGLYLALQALRTLCWLFMDSSSVGDTFCTWRNNLHLLLQFHSYQQWGINGQFTRVQQKGHRVILYH